MKVTVRAPARLHLGLLDLRGDLGRLFGGMGVAINWPTVVVEAETSDRLAVSGERAELANFYAELFLRKYCPRAQVALMVKQTIPQHVGLGSGTQLALATATSLAKLCSVKASIQELAWILGRGQVSGVGTALFQKGGFVVESGVKSQKNKPVPSGHFSPVIFQEPFPEDWLFVVAIPNVKGGLSGQAEAKAFDTLPPMPKETADEISHLLVMSLLPALKEKDIFTFGASLTRIQSLVGDCFVSAQGGRFSSSPSGDTIAYMLKHGAYGAGQSSWGPTVYGLVNGETQAEKLVLQVQDFLGESVGGRVFSTTVNNRGAYIKVAGRVA